MKNNNTLFVSHSGFGVNVGCKSDLYDQFMRCCTAGAILKELKPTPEYKSTMASIDKCLGSDDSPFRLPMFDLLDIVGVCDHPYGLAKMLAYIMQYRLGKHSLTPSFTVKAVHDEADSDNILVAFDFAESFGSADKQSSFETAIAMFKTEFLRLAISCNLHTATLDNTGSYLTWLEKANWKDMAFCIDTPVGKLSITAKSGDSEAYPGVYVDYVSETGDLVQLACTEYDPAEETICTDVFPNCDGVTTRLVHDGIAKLHTPTKDKLIQQIKDEICAFEKAEYGTDEQPCFDDLSAIPLAFAESEDEKIQFQLYADLSAHKLKIFIRPTGSEEFTYVADWESYDGLKQMCEELCLYPNCFDSLPYALTKEEWAKFTESKLGREWLRKEYPVGTRVKLEYMSDTQAPPVGSEGTVHHVDDLGAIHVRWDKGGSLRLLYGCDVFTVIGKDGDKT